MDNEIFYTKFDSKIGVVILVGNQDGLMNLELEKHDGMRKFKLEATWIRNDDFFHEIIKQLKEYFSGTRKRFERIKINFQGTEYQQKVWKQLMEIPYGECWSYKDVAIAIGNPKASRAVGMANSKNKIPIIIPCHRVIGASGKLTGFAHGLTLKKKLLDLEEMNNHG